MFSTSDGGLRWRWKVTSIVNKTVLLKCRSVSHHVIFCMSVVRCRLILCSCNCSAAVGTGRQHIQASWPQLTLVCCTRAVDQFPKRMNATIAAGGGHVEHNRNKTCLSFLYEMLEMLASLSEAFQPSSKLLETSFLKPWIVHNVQWSLCNYYSGQNDYLPFFFEGLITD